MADKLKRPSENRIINGDTSGGLTGWDFSLSVSIVTIQGKQYFRLITATGMSQVLIPPGKFPRIRLKFKILPYTFESLDNIETNFWGSLILVSNVGTTYIDLEGVR